MSDQTPPRDLATINQFAERYPWAKAGGLRWQVFNEQKNGLQEAGAVVRVGRKVLIDVPRYFEWIDKQQGRAA